MTLLELEIVKGIIDYTSKNYFWDIFSILLTGLAAASFLRYFEFRKEKNIVESKIKSEITKSLDNILKVMDISSKILIEEPTDRLTLNNLSFFFPEIKDLSFYNNIWVTGNNLNITIDNDFNNDNFNFHICFSDLNTNIRLLKSYLTLPDIDKDAFISVKEICNNIIFYEKCTIDYLTKVLLKEYNFNSSMYINTDIYKGSISTFNDQKNLKLSLIEIHSNINNISLEIINNPNNFYKEIENIIDSAVKKFNVNKQVSANLKSRQRILNFATVAFQNKFKENQS